MKKLVLDTNLLVLFIVGSASKEYISRHKKLTEFLVQDYELLVQLIGDYEVILLTPNILTEASNLIRYIKNPAKSMIVGKYNQLVTTSTEHYIESKVAILNQNYRPLGLADAALLELLGNDEVLITTDLDLFLSAQDAGKQAINFNHLRDSYLN